MNFHLLAESISLQRVKILKHSEDQRRILQGKRI